MGLLFSLSKSDFNRLSSLHEDSPDSSTDDNTDYTTDNDNNTNDNTADQNTNDNAAENNNENNQDNDASDDNSDGSDNTDYTDMNFDSSDDSGSGDSDNNDSSGDDNNSSGGDDDNSNEKVDDIKKQEEELYNNLTPEQLDIKHKELKRNYLALYELVDAIIEKISAANLSEDNISIIEFASNSLVKLKDMIIDYMQNVYKTKSYIENSIIYNRYLATLTAINKMLEEINIPTE